MKLNIVKSNKKAIVDFDNLGFGKIFTNHIFVMEYNGGEWKNPQIKPYGAFDLDPSTAVFHYGQAVFEGLKAYKNSKGEIRLFRPQDNFKRMNESCDRVCIPNFDEKFVLDAMTQLVKIDSGFIPTKAGSSLYIRPSIIATDAVLGVHPSSSYLFFIICSPVGAYYKNGFGPIKLLVEEYYTRAALGGTGANKVIGNYAASLIAQQKAMKLGCNQVMWLDAKDKRFVEEVGAMNIFFVLGDKVITHALNGSILPGLTRDSVIRHLKYLGYDVSEQQIDINDIVKYAKDKTLTEIFGTGTAAVISPVSEFLYKDENFAVGSGGIGKITQMLYDDLTSIQTGVKNDPHGFVKLI